ncbi:glycogen synthase [Limisalsivibrio acetivorans]|uniref:glycogen synthase n=1 Tax=Limisalsivibrio acetivorans TaxID=1304888 RepID=UPI0003B34DEE|nr:glycogen synthase [Limisalsivibrio acetivorans]
MRVVHIASEAGPFVKSGGLGNVLEKLPAALHSAETDVCVMLPLYLQIDRDEHALEETGFRTSVRSGFNDFEYTIYRKNQGGVEYLFFHNAELFDRHGIYGNRDFDYSDNDIRFGTFSRACLNYIDKMEKKPDIIHCHDWQTGLVPVYLHYNYPRILSRTVYTIHDIAFQGSFSRGSMDSLGLPWDVYCIDGIEFYDHVSFLKGGVVFSDRVTTVSPAYAEEIQTEDIAEGMAGVMREYSSKLQGILNGIDYAQWNPDDDPHIVCRCEHNDRKWKQLNKQELAKEFCIESKRPLFVMVSRFSHKKGLDLFIDSAEELSELDADFIVLGHGDIHYSRALKSASEKYDNIHLYQGYYQALAHKLYAAADFVMVPSVYEPFGTSHLIGMRYGAVPLVSTAGGLKDTVKDITDGGHGLVMKQYSREEFMRIIATAMELFADSDILQSQAVHFMGLDYSWRRTAGEYMKLYDSLCGGKE